MNEEKVWRLVCSGPDHTGPRVLQMLKRENTIGPEQGARFLGRLWAVLDHPLRSLSFDDWVELWRWVGYTHTPHGDGLWLMPHGHRIPRPDEPLVLWRGATDEFAYGMSWTDDFDLARRYACQGPNPRPDRRPGKVWQATVQPEMLLGQNSCFWGEHEIVIDPRMHMTEVSP